MTGDEPGTSSRLRRARRQYGCRAGIRPPGCTRTIAATGEDQP